MKRRIFFILSIGLLLVFLTSNNRIILNADVGPKPSVTVKVKTLDYDKCYLTLLSKTDRSGPWSVDREYRDWDNETLRLIDQKFAAYSDPDNFYYLHHFQEVSVTQDFSWSYYPPETFKVLVYIEDNDSFIIGSEILERYAFNSHYVVEIKDNSLTIVKNYDYLSEILNLLGRMLITVAIELAIAWLFTYRKHELTLILVVNIITQLILNVFLNITNYHQGIFYLIFVFLLGEIIVLLTEAIIYIMGMKRLAKKYNYPHKSVGHHVFYVIVANFASLFGGGLLLFFL